MKKWQKIVAVVVVVLFVLGVMKDVIIKMAVTAGASTVLGTAVHIDSLSVGILKSAVSIKGFKIYNPSGFPAGAMIDLREVTVRYDLLAALTGTIHLPLVVVDLTEMVIITNKEGAMNVDALKVAQEPQRSAKAGEKKAPASAKQMPMRIDEARFNLGTVIVKDYSQGAEPSVIAYSIGVHNKVYKNITSAEQLATLLMLETMGPAGLKGAAIYGAATVLGVAFLPAGIVGVLVGKDHASVEFIASRERAYKEAVTLVKKIGEIVKEEPSQYTFNAKVYGADVTVNVDDKGSGKSEVIIKARKMMIPKPEVAEGIMYQLSQKLRKANK